MKKYVFVPNNTIVIGSAVLTCIKAIRRIETVDGVVEPGTLGGFIQAEKNLSHEGNCWVSPDSAVLGKASVIGDALVKASSLVCGRAQVGGTSVISGSKLNDCSKAFDADVIDQELHGIDAAPKRQKVA